jgi:hypothetical protein
MKQNLKMNLLYIICQTLGEACVVLSNISLYALAHHKTLDFLSSYYPVLSMVTCFYPFRYSSTECSRLSRPRRPLQDQ